MSMSYECRKKAMDLLARRPHFRRELAAKLLKRGFSEEEIDAELDLLEEENLLDDRNLARETVARRIEREPIGRRRLWADLMRHGAEAEVVEEALDAVYPTDDYDLALAAAERRMRRSPPPDAQKLARHLSQRGFSSASVMRIVKNLSE